jgi:broad specificity phosphatase PhoE
MIYLLRHFEVIDSSDRMMDSKHFDSWVNEYDTFDLVYTDVLIPSVHQIYCSSLQRCIKTAQYLNLDVQITDDLVEVDAKAAFKISYKLPKILWLLIDRFLWYFNLSTHEKHRETIQRAENFIDHIDHSKDTLIVSHGLFLKVLIKRLNRRGYEGKNDIAMKHSHLYKLELK